jgi:hypothetical protein
MRKEYAEILKDYARKRHKTSSKMLDRVMLYALAWLISEDKFHKEYPEMFNDGLVELKTVGEIGNAVKIMEEELEKLKNRETLSGEVKK